ncbi:DUF397 domain-containing protein [Streptomyces sp. WSLK1-5]|uniref:DUF397 domain-containing protein n=1 Tax=unclassified Streptomyces TaxID=2593676 RepID=UPI00379DE005
MREVPSANQWIKSSFSGENGACVELACCDHEVLVRDSKNPCLTTVSFSMTAWEAFVTQTAASAGGCR